MRFKQVLFSSLLWRGIYFFTVLLLNIIVSRYYEAAATGWIYYISNYFSFILLLASLSLESGMTYYAAQKKISRGKLATLSLIWSAVAALLIVGLLWLFYVNDAAPYSKKEFILFALTYTTGLILTNYFCALFYTQQNYQLPNGIMSVANIITSVVIVLLFSKGAGNAPALALKVYFINFLVQGVLLSIAFLRSNRLAEKMQLPTATELRLLVNYSMLSLVTNIVFFLLYRIDYWLVKKTCTVCAAEDLGNYIQASKLAQLLLLLPTIMAGAVFPETANANQQALHQPVKKLAFYLFWLCVLGCAMLAVSGHWLFVWVFGSSFNNMYTPFVLLIPGILALTVVRVVAAHFAGLNLVKHNLTGGILALVVIVLGDWWLIPIYGIAAAAAVSSVGYLLYMGYLLLQFNKKYATGIGSFFYNRQFSFTEIKKLLLPPNK
jgi:O-antigen/teichoic acid export membrane protein